MYAGKGEEANDESLHYLPSHLNNFQYFFARWKSLLLFSLSLPLSLFRPWRLTNQSVANVVYSRIELITVSSSAIERRPTLIFQCQKAKGKWRVFLYKKGIWSEVHLHSIRTSLENNPILLSTVDAKPILIGNHWGSGRILLVWTGWVSQREKRNTLASRWILWIRNCPLSIEKFRDPLGPAPDERQLIETKVSSTR